jgi:hypothetical protein
MTKMIKMSLIAAVAVTGITSTVSAQPLEEAIKGVDVSGLLRYRYNESSSGTVHSSSNEYVMEINTINKAEKRRVKRSFDITFSFLLLLLSWFIVWYMKDKKRFFTNVFLVLIGFKSWVGYAQIHEKPQPDVLPKIKIGILYPGIEFDDLTMERADKMNLLYLDMFQTQLTKTEETLTDILYPHIHNYHILLQMPPLHKTMVLERELSENHDHSFLFE